MTPPLYHFSEKPHIEQFIPRPVPAGNTNSGLSGEMVWAVSPEKAYLYYFPRDCPRVTFYAAPDTTEADRDRLLHSTTARCVVAIESAWLSRLQETQLYRYAFDPTTFTCFDPTAGYHISRETIVPLTITPLPNLLTTLAEDNIEIRILPNLWKLADTVIASTVGFSLIRMRNAAPRL